MKWIRWGLGTIVYNPQEEQERSRLVPRRRNSSERSCCPAADPQPEAPLPTAQAVEHASCRTASSGCGMIPSSSCRARSSRCWPRCTANPAPVRQQGFGGRSRCGGSGHPNNHEMSAPRRHHGRIWSALRNSSRCAWPRADKPRVKLRDRIARSWGIAARVPGSGDVERADVAEFQPA